MKQYKINKNGKEYHIFAKDEISAVKKLRDAEFEVGKTYTTKNGNEFTVTAIKEESNGYGKPETYVYYDFTNKTSGNHGSSKSTISFLRNSTKAKVKDYSAIQDKSTYKLAFHNDKWYYEITNDDGSTKLVGPYSSAQEARVWFAKHRPNDKLQDKSVFSSETIKDADKTYTIYGWDKNRHLECKYEKITDLKEAIRIANALKEDTCDAVDIVVVEGNNKTKIKSFDKSVFSPETMASVQEGIEDNFASMRTRLSKMYDFDVKDAKQEYKINYKNTYSGVSNSAVVNAENVKEALNEFGKYIASRGIGTANINVLSISPNDGYMKLYGKLSDLLKTSLNDAQQYYFIWTTERNHAQKYFNDAKKLCASGVDATLSNTEKFIYFTSSDKSALEKTLKNVREFDFSSTTTDIKVLDKKSIKDDRVMWEFWFTPENLKLYKTKYVREDGKIDYDNDKYTCEYKGRNVGTYSTLAQAQSKMKSLGLVKGDEMVMHGLDSDIESKVFAANKVEDKTVVYSNLNTTSDDTYNHLKTQYVDKYLKGELDNKEFVKRVINTAYRNNALTGLTFSQKEELLSMIKDSAIKDAGSDYAIYTLQSDVDKNLTFYIGKKYALKDGMVTWIEYSLEKLNKSPQQLKNELLRNGWHEISNRPVSLSYHEKDQILSLLNKDSAIKDDEIKSKLIPVKRIAIDGREWWVPFDNVKKEYVSSILFGKYATKWACQYDIDLYTKKYPDNFAIKDDSISDERLTDATYGNPNKYSIIVYGQWGQEWCGEADTEAEAKKRVAELEAKKTNPYNHYTYKKGRVTEEHLSDSKCKDESIKEKLIKLWAYTYGQSKAEAKKHIDTLSDKEIEEKYKLLNQGFIANAKKSFYEDSAIKDAHYIIGGYIGKYDPKAREDIRQASKYGVNGYIEKTEDGYQLVLRGEKEKLIKCLEDYFGLDTSSIGDSNCKDAERYLIRKDSGAGEVVYGTNDLQDAIEELKALGRSYYIDDTQKDITIKYSQAVKMTNTVNDADFDTVTERKDLVRYSKEWYAWLRSVMEKRNLDYIWVKFTPTKFGKFEKSKLQDVEPNKDESKEDFISRFMSETKEEYPDEKQRYAVANSYWERRNLKDTNPLVEVRRDIEKIKQRLNGKPVRENFGQDEVRKLKEKYSQYQYGQYSKVFDLIDEFDNWCNNYTG